jgi:hypothetical protein
LCSLTGSQDFAEAASLSPSSAFVVSSPLAIGCAGVLLAPFPLFSFRLCVVKLMTVLVHTASA